MVIGTIPREFVCLLLASEGTRSKKTMTINSKLAAFSSVASSSAAQYGQN